FPMTDPGMASAPVAAPSSDARPTSRGSVGFGALRTAGEHGPSGRDPVPGEPRRYSVLMAAFFLPADLLGGIARYAREQRWRLSTDMVHTGVMPTRWRGDGIITFVGSASDPTACVEDLRVPKVTLNLAAECVAEPRVEPDDFAIGCLAARHLLERN